jgi:cytochrome c oxidase subunit 2
MTSGMYTIFNLIFNSAFSHANSDTSGSSFMPPAVTEIAKQVDSLYSFLLISSAIGCVILIGGMIYFVLKYKRKSNNDKTAYITHNTFLEFLWSFIPLVVFLVVFAWGWKVYHDMRAMPQNALEVHVVGKQWAWDFIYKSGKVSGNEFYVPVNTPVKLIMSSTDVLHSFYVPSMRIKQDVVPGRYTNLWFKAEKLGDFHVFCTEYCGAAHSNMLAKLKVVSMDEYEKWLQENDEGLSLAEKGKKYYSSKGCVACHSVDGTTKVGPTWKAVFSTQRTFEDGSNAIGDENYIRESILNPNAKVVKGFAKGVMPSYQGQLSEVELNSLIEYIKELK